VFYKLAPYLHSDYGARGIAIIGVFMLTRGFPLKLIPQLLGLGWFTLQYGNIVSFWGLRFPFQAPGILAMAPISLYSGRKLTRHPTLNWSFNLFYPVHLALIFAFKLILK